MATALLGRLATQMAVAEDRRSDTCRVVVSQVIGGYRGDKSIELCKLRPDELHCLMCQSWSETSEIGYTRIISSIDQPGRLLLEGIVPVREPIRLILEVWSKEGIRRGEFADIEIVEVGLSRGRAHSAPVGGLTVRFEH